MVEEHETCTAGIYGDEFVVTVVLAATSTQDCEWLMVFVMFDINKALHLTTESKNEANVVEPLFETKSCEVQSEFAEHIPCLYWFLLVFSEIILSGDASDIRGAR